MGLTGLTFIAIGPQVTLTLDPWFLPSHFPGHFFVVLLVKLFQMHGTALLVLTFSMLLFMPAFLEGVSDFREPMKDFL